MKRESSWAKHQGQTGFAVYRLFDAQGQLLYVGATKDIRARMYGHTATRKWWPDVEKSATMVTWYATVEEAADAEEFAIENEHPLHNSGKHRYVSPTGVRKTPIVAPSKAECGDWGSLAEVSATIRESKARIKELAGERDQAVREAIEAGYTWKQVMEAGRMSRRGVHLALERARQA